MSIRGRTCCGVLACGALVAAFSAFHADTAGADASGFYVALGGELGMANFGLPSVKSYGMPGTMLGVAKDHSSLVKFAEFDPAARVQGEFSVLYRPKYKRSFGLPGAFGYRFGSFRVQLGTYSSSFSVDDGEHIVSRHASWFAFPVRIPGDKTISRYHVGEVSEVGLSSIELSACYSGLGVGHETEGNSFKLYSCLGVGVTSVDYFGSQGCLGLSWSGRAGAEYTVSPQLSLFAEAYYLGVGTREHGGRVSMLLPLTGGGVSPASGFRSMLDIGYFGSVTGVRYTFSSS
ncbi:P44/Msp2 family outer membrane protein [Anaplasma capra]|uniref:P44/Msp2 family outer membrane protein n=1 Tax=Anaplasma capra TaxID=1562740 RepID=UPI0021D573E8|nr:P44/Msp2 family outer membrane protein [Anaplasma capra]MCU7611318.1 P44/Msp2 family outer membrane protein [Anaplasma capra]